MSTFNPPADIAQITLAKSSDVNALKAATAIAFGLLPDEDKIQQNSVTYAVDTGTANTYQISLPAITSYSDGLSVSFKPINSNTGQSTIQINTLGTKSIRLVNSQVVALGDIISGAPVQLIYSSTTGYFHVAANSATYATIATTKAGEAATSASNAANSEEQAQSNADFVDAVALSCGQNAILASQKATDAANSATSASNASTSASNAAISAASSAVAAAASYDSFDDRYLGAKSSNPTVDNDGNALLTGALYWNTTSSEMRVYSGSAWVTAYLPSSGYLALSGGTMTGAVTFASGQFGTNVNTFLSTPSSANLAAALTDETGTGVNVFNNAPTLIAPLLGTPASGTLTNCTGYTYANLSGTIPTWNQNTTGTAANLTSATTLPSGMTLVAPLLGTPASGTLTNCTGYTYANLGGTVPTWNQNTTGTAGNVTGIVGVANGGTGTATPSLVAGSNVTVTGTWPNQTIAATGGGGGGSATKTISNKTAAYTIVSGDLGTIINCTSGTFTVSLTAAASLGSGFTCTIWNTSTTLTDAITIDPAGAETIDGKTTLILRVGEGLSVVCDGTNWETDDKKPMRNYAENCANTNIRPIATGTNSVAIGNSNTASGTGSCAIGYATQATSLYGFAIGTNSGNTGSVTATGSGAMALGGSYASGTDSFAAAVTNNTSSYGAKANNSVAIGKNAATNGFNSISIGNTALNNGSNGIAIGSSCTTSNGGVSIGASNNAVADKTFSIGYYSQTNQYGKYAYASGLFAANGDSQYGLMVLRASTTTTTAVALTSDAGAAGTTNQLIVASNQAMAISGTLIAKQSSSVNMAGWTITGIVSNNSGTMAVSGLALTAIGTDSIGLGTAPTIAVDNTNKGVTITSGYKAATNIRWVANVQTSEVTYA